MSPQKIIEWSKTDKFQKKYKKLDKNLQDKVNEALKKLVEDIKNPGLRFEKLKGTHNPPIYSIHATDNLKITMSIEGNHAILRVVDFHNNIDRNP